MENIIIDSAGLGRFWQHVLGAIPSYTLNDGTTDGVWNISLASSSGGTTTIAMPKASTNIFGGIKAGANLTINSGVLSLSKDNVVAALGYTPPETGAIYTAGSGINISTNNVISNDGVLDVVAGTTNGCVGVETSNGTTQVAVGGLGTAAYENSSFFATASHTHNYVSIFGGAVSGRLYSSVTVEPSLVAFRNIKILSPSDATVVEGVTAIPDGEIWIRYQ